VEEEGRDVPPLPRTSFWISWDSSMPICPRQKVFFFFVVIVVVTSALLGSSFAGLLLPSAPAFSFEWREPSSSYSPSVRGLRNVISGTASSTSAMFRSVALLLRSDQVIIIIIIISCRQTGLQMALSGCREARGHHHLPAGFGFLRPPVCQLSCCLSPCP
jgi:hypothetical protein